MSDSCKFEQIITEDHKALNGNGEGAAGGIIYRTAALWEAHMERKKLYHTLLLGMVLTIMANLGTIIVMVWTFLERN